MKKGDKIIWNSGFGYEVGYFVSKESHVYGHWHVDLVTGRYVKGEFHAWPSEIKPYSEKLISELKKEYGYEKKLND